MRNNVQQVTLFATSMQRNKNGEETYMCVCERERMYIQVLLFKDYPWSSSSYIRTPTD